jgi:YHS domain-containing protein
VKGGNKMLCCAGLIGGLVVGQALGGPWVYIAPAAGFGIGLVADMKFMKGHHHNMGHQHHTGFRAGKDTDPVCGMEVEQLNAEHQVEHMGKTFYFCAPACKKAFQKDPEKYIGKAQKAAVGQA